MFHAIYRFVVNTCEYVFIRYSIIGNRGAGARLPSDCCTCVIAQLGEALFAEVEIISYYYSYAYCGCEHSGVQPNVSHNAIHFCGHACQLYRRYETYS